MRMFDDEVSQMSNLDSTIQNAVLRAGGNDGMSDKSSLKDLYNKAKNIGYTDALGLARQAESDEERNFFAFVADMNLQREQRKAIERNVF